MASLHCTDDLYPIKWSRRSILFLGKSRKFHCACPQSPKQAEDAEGNEYIECHVAEEYRQEDMPPRLP